MNPTVPPSITIAAGQTTGTFTVSTFHASVVKYATIRAEANEVGKDMRLKVKP